MHKFCLICPKVKRELQVMMFLVPPCPNCRGLIRTGCLDSAIRKSPGDKISCSLGIFYGRYDFFSIAWKYAVGIMHFSTHKSIFQPFVKKIMHKFLKELTKRMQKNTSQWWENQHNNQNCHCNDFCRSFKYEFEGHLFVLYKKGNYVSNNLIYFIFRSFIPSSLKHKWLTTCTNW